MPDVCSLVQFGNWWMVFCPVLPSVVATRLVSMQNTWGAARHRAVAIASGCTFASSVVASPMKAVCATFLMMALASSAPEEEAAHAEGGGAHATTGGWCCSVSMRVCTVLRSPVKRCCRLVSMLNT